MQVKPRFVNVILCYQLFYS